MMPSDLPARPAHVGDHYPAGQREHQREGVLGHRERVGVGAVQHLDPAPPRRRDVDAVQPRPGPANRAQLVAMLDHRGRHLGRAAYNQRVVVAHDRLKLFALQPRPNLDRRVLAQERDPVGVDWIADQNSRLTTIHCLVVPFLT